MPHNAEICTEIERGCQNCYATSFTHFLILQFKNKGELTPRKVVHGLVPQKKLYTKRKKSLRNLPKRPLNHSVLTFVIKLETPSH